jgi:hypothetical protein
LSEPAQQPKRITASTLLTTVILVAIVQVGALAVSTVNIQIYPAIVNSSGTSGDIAGAAGVPGGSPAATAINILFLVGFAFAATLVLLWLVRHKLVLSFKLLVFGSMALAGFVLTVITVGDFAASYLGPDEGLIVGVVASLAVVAVIAYTIFVKNRPWLSNVVIAFVGAEVGSFFAGTLSPIGSFPWMTLLLPLAFAVYDIYAVFKGPLKHLVGSAPGLTLNGLSVRLGEFTLGLGDIVFYTMLPSVALLYVSYARGYADGLYASLVTMLVIDAGVAATLYLLSRRRLLPGLPIPMLLGVTVVASFLLLR